MVAFQFPSVYDIDIIYYCCRCFLLLVLIGCPLHLCHGRLFSILSLYKARGWHGSADWQYGLEKTCHCTPSRLELTSPRAFVLLIPESRSSHHPSFLGALTFRVTDLMSAHAHSCTSLSLDTERIIANSVSQFHQNVRVPEACKGIATGVRVD